MHVFYVVSGSIAKSGELQELCSWAFERIANKKAKIVKILKVRPGEPYGRIVMEIDDRGITSVRSGRLIAVSKLKKAAKDG